MTSLALLNNGSLVSMPSMQLHKKFDAYLVDHGIIQKRDFSIVHKRINTLIQVHGHWNQSYQVYYGKVGVVREWIKSWFPLLPQETLIDYVRVVLGHFILDERWAKYYFADDYGLMKSAFRSYMRRGFGKLWFKKRILAE